MKAYIILENGVVFAGESFGASGETVGEVVFATGMTGYLETLTDPSYCGQIVVQTFPLIGNYGVIPEDFESPNTGAKAYIVKYPCHNPSNFRSENNLDAFLKERGVIGLCGIDTRALTRIIRTSGVMNGKITAAVPTTADQAEAQAYTIHDPVAAVSAPAELTGTGRRRVALIDFGAKRGIADALAANGCQVSSFPHNASAAQILASKPQGIMLSNGPGDPADSANAAIVETIRVLEKSGIPLFGICLGHQLLALAKGHTTRTNSNLGIAEQTSR